MGDIQTLPVWRGCFFILPHWNESVWTTSVFFFHEKHAVTVIAWRSRAEVWSLWEAHNQEEKSTKGRSYILAFPASKSIIRKIITSPLEIVSDEEEEGQWCYLMEVFSTWKKTSEVEKAEEAFPPNRQDHRIHHAILKIGFTLYILIFH